MRDEPEQIDDLSSIWSPDHPSIQSLYRSLDQGYIRLLKLLPGNDQDDIRCELAIVPLSENLHYEAISYTWGSPNYQKMFLDGKKTLAGHNLLACLSSLRLFETARLLWVDALCINQADDLEKGQQVSVMSQIYAAASRTIIWLGDDNLGWRDQLREQWAKSTWPIDTGKIPDIQDYHPWTLLRRLSNDEHIEYNYQCSTQAEYLNKICALEWWSRIWVVQETLLSRSAILFLGKDTLPWDVAYRAALNYVRHSTSCCLPAKANAESQTYARLLSESMFEVVQVILSFQRIPEGSSNELLANLWMYRNRLASLELDKMYGILGLLRSKDISIETDYQKSFVQACQEVVLEDIRISDNLEALRGIRPRATLSPSWCTDWNNLDYWTEDQARILSDLYKRNYSASKTSKPQVKIKDLALPPSFARVHILQVAGGVIDVANFVFPSSLTASSEITKLFSSITERVQSIRHGSSYISGGSIVNAIWRCLIGDCILPSQEGQNIFHNIDTSAEARFIPQIRRARSSDLFAFLLWWLSELQHRHLWRILKWEPAFGNTLDFAGHLRRIPAIADIKASVVRACSGRCFFVTSKGYIGLGPLDMKEGDRVAVLLGGSVPFVLRRETDGDVRGKFFQIIGDCYVQGLMDGEGLEDQDTDKWPILDIV